MDRSVRVRVLRRFGCVLLLAALLAPVLPAQVVRAAAVSVSIQTDVVSGCANNGIAPCSLRDAVVYANAHPGTVINVPAGTYTLTIPATCPSNDAICGDLNLTANVTITGAGAASTIIQASATDSSTGIDRVFRVDSGTATISGMTVRNGKPSDGGNGGGIFLTANGLLTLNNVTVSGNEGTGYGGGIFADNTLTITDSTISGNMTTGNAGGIGQGGGTLTLANGVVSNNTSANDGGGLGIFNASAGSIANSTISGNRANQNLRGGGLFLSTSGIATLTSDTIARNSAFNGGGIRIQGGTVNLRNTIIASNSGFVADVGGSIVSQGYNLVGSTFGSSGFGGTDLLNVNAQLGPLQYNGGSTQTVAPALNSSAVDAIPAANCAVTTDQRGTPRPQGTSCDIGAVELIALPLALNNASGTAGATVTFSGSNFRTGLALKIASVSATIGSVAADGNTFTATVPSPHASGNVSMIVTNPDLTTASATFTYTGANLTSIAIAPTNPSIAKGTTQQFTAMGTYSDSTTADITSAVTWQSVTGSVATIDNTAGNNGVATGVGTGSTTIKASLSAVTSNNATLTVTGAVLTSIAVTPANLQIAKGTTQQFAATGTFSDGSHQDLTASVTWASGATGVATVSDTAGTKGLATGVSPGTVTITATSGAVSGGTSLAVTDATLTSIAVAPASANIANGTNQQFTATGTYSDASTATITSSVLWQSSDPTKATINAGGQATGIATGSTTITATLNGVTSNNASLTVTAAILTSIAVTPTSPVIANGTTRQFTATGTFSDGTPQDLTTDPSVTWQSDTPGVATISSIGATKGQATAVAPGTAQIIATRNGVSSGTTLTVTNASLTSIAVTPANPSIVKGATQQFTALGTFSDASTADLTSSVTWVSSNQGMATISNAVGSHGVATAVVAGTTTITATQGGVTSNSAALTVPKTLQSIAITPANLNIRVGATVQLTATGTYSDTTTQDLTAQVQWSGSDGNVASVDAGGKVMGQSPGTVTIKAMLSGVTGQTQVTVISPTVIGIIPVPAPRPADVAGGGGSPAPIPKGR